MHVINNFIVFNSDSVHQGLLMPTRVTIDTTRLNNLIARSGRNNRQFIKSVGFAVEALAKMKAPVDTGALRASIYTRTNESNPLADSSTEQLPEPTSRDSVVVGPTVEYAIYQEFSGQAFLIPALREIERQLEANPRMASDIVNE